MKTLKYLNSVRVNLSAGIRSLVTLAEKSMGIFIVLSLALVPMARAADEAPPEDEAEKVVANMTPKDGEALNHRCLKEEDMNSCYLFAAFAATKLVNFGLYRLAAERACKLGHAVSCQKIIMDDRVGDDIRNKCEKGDVESCALYSKGRGLMYGDSEGELIYARKACTLGHKSSCEKIKAQKTKLKNK